MAQGNDTQSSVGNAIFPYLLQLCNGERCDDEAIEQGRGR